MTATMRAPTAPTSGYRDILDARLHDLDEKTHMVIYEFPVAIDTYRTEFGPGAFQAGWDRQLPVMCANHNQDAVIGRAVRAESLPNAHRLVGKFADFEHVPAARSAWSCVKDGIYPGASFHFVQGDAVPHPTVRSALQYRSARMIEFGPCLAPSLPGKHLVGIRSRTAQATRSDPRGDILRTLARIEIDHIDQVVLEQVRRSGKLPQAVASRCYEAGTRQSELDVELLVEFGEACVRAEQTRSDFARRGL